MTDKWRQRLGEALVITLSILAAFAVDAWWDGAKDRSRARGEVASLQSEFEAVDRELARATAELQTALEGTLALAKAAGPRPEPMPAATFSALLTKSLTINAVQLPTGALANLLSSGDLPLLGNLTLQTNLASWPSIATLMSVKFGYLVTNRDEAILPALNQLIAFSKMLASGFSLVWSDDNHFDFDATPALASREFENLMAQRWINIQIALLTVTDARKLSETIRADLAAWR